MLCIAFFDTGEDLPLKGGLIANTSIQTVSGNDGEFDLHHVQPTGMVRGRVHLKPFRQGKGFWRRKGRIKRSGRMGIQIILHEDQLPVRLTVVIVSGLSGSGCDESNVPR